MYTHVHIYIHIYVKICVGFIVPNSLFLLTPMKDSNLTYWIK